MLLELAWRCKRIWSTDRHILGIGSRGAAGALGKAERLAVSAPMAIVDPDMRETLGDEPASLGESTKSGPRRRRRFQGAAVRRCPADERADALLVCFAFRRLLAYRRAPARRSRAALSDNRRSGVVTSAMPKKNPGPEMKRKSAIHRDSEKEISEVKAGINRKNIVT